MQISRTCSVWSFTSALKSHLFSIILLVSCSNIDIFLSFSFLYSEKFKTNIVVLIWSTFHPSQVFVACILLWYMQSMQSSWKSFNRSFFFHNSQISSKTTSLWKLQWQKLNKRNRSYPTHNTDSPWSEFMLLTRWLLSKLCLILTPFFNHSC